MKKIITLFLFFCLFFSARGAYAQTFNPATVNVTEHGMILLHGQTFGDLWSETINHPPLDGSINSWSFYSNGDQIVTKENNYWILSSGSNRWTGPLNLKTKWQNCSNFPSSGVDAYSIKPATKEEFAFKNQLLFSIDLNGQCTRNGINQADYWRDHNASPVTQSYPLKNYSRITQFQWLDDNSQVYFTEDKMWLIGNNSASLCSSQQPAPLSWKFCEPETLTARWGTKENHPPLTGITIYAVSYNPSFHEVSVGDHIWDLGRNGIWTTFLSGIDGYGMREPYIFFDNGKYYLYYDAIEGGSSWKTAYAVADHPLGPWKKMGLVSYTGVIRNWEQQTSCAATVIKEGNTYYNFYLGASTFFGGDIYRIPFHDRSYYKLGLAISDKPQGPFQKVPGDGTKNKVTASSLPVLSAPSTGWHADNTVSAQGSFIKINGEWHYTVTSRPDSSDWGVGIAKLTGSSLLGPWQEIPDPLIPPQGHSENAGAYYDPVSGYYFIFSNAVYDPVNGILNPTRWADYSTGCGQQSAVGVVMYFSKNPFSWDWQTNQRMITNVQKGYGCSGETNYNPLSGSPILHRGNTGLGFPVYVPEENRLYVVFDGNDFRKGNNQDHMFRNIYVVSFSLPRASILFDLSSLVLKFNQNVAGGTREDVDNSGKINSLDFSSLMWNFGR